jgi:hypothetical protein
MVSLRETSCGVNLGVRVYKGTVPQACVRVCVLVNFVSTVELEGTK